jgi:branched-chain amino acid transport system substrate-binding protein
MTARLLNSRPVRLWLLIVAAGALALVVVTGGSSGLASAASNKAPITIGISVSLSGDFSADGQAFEAGYQLWARDVNRAGGLLGRQVKLDFVSDASSPAQVVTNYQKLISGDHVQLVFGPFSTILTAVAGRVAARYGYTFPFGAAAGPTVFGQGLHNLFLVSTPPEQSLDPVAQFLAGLPKSRRPTTVAYASSQDPFTRIQIPNAQKLIARAGLKTVYSTYFPAEVTDFSAIATAVAASHAQVVVIGSNDVPTVASFVQTFVQQHYSPKLLVATAGPDQGDAFVKAVGAANTDGILVPGGWYSGYQNASSEKMVHEYLALHGGTPAQISNDVAEAYAVGEVMAQAVQATHSIDNKTLTAYLNSGVTLHSVQGPVHFNSVGENTTGANLDFQWQKGHYVQVLPPGKSNGSVPIEYPKPNWGS